MPSNTIPNYPTTRNISIRRIEKSSETVILKQYANEIYFRLQFTPGGYLMVDKFAKVIGLVLFVIGILGFISPLTPNGKLLGVFLVDPVHNMVHLIAGVILFAVGYSSNCILLRRTVLAFAAFYGLLGVFGFVKPVIFGMHLNLADNLLHLGIMTSALLFALPEHHMTQSG
jgi:hypothetical protein